MIRRKLSVLVKSALKNQVYTARYGFIAGMKRRGGIDFLPKRIAQERRYLMDLNLNNKTVYDIGGYIGILTMFFSRAVGAAGRVITFEPNPRNCQAIQEHLQLNAIKNVTLIPLAVGSKTDTLPLVVGDTPGEGSLVAQFQEKIKTTSAVQSYPVAIKPLDEIVKTYDLPKPDLVKIDVEGFEMDVLLGMQEVIRTYKPQFHIELHGIQNQEIGCFLLERGYKIFQIEKSVWIDPHNVNLMVDHIFAS